MHGDQLGACGHQCPLVGTSRHFAIPEFGRYRSHSGHQASRTSQARSTRRRWCREQPAQEPPAVGPYLHGVTSARRAACGPVACFQVRIGDMDRREQRSLDILRRSVAGRDRYADHRRRQQLQHWYRPRHGRRRGRRFVPHPVHGGETGPSRRVCSPSSPFKLALALAARGRHI
jgi:hypothetical protein